MTALSGWGECFLGILPSYLFFGTWWLLAALLDDCPLQILDMSVL